MREIGAVMALLHVSYQLQDLIRIKAFERQYYFQEPLDLRDRKRWCFFFQPAVQVPEKEMRQHTREHVMVPARVFAHFIVVHPQLRFRFLEALFDRPPHATEPHEQA